VFELPFVAEAGTVFTYVSVKSEVRTRDLIERLWNRHQTVVVPTLVGDELQMSRITDWDDIVVDAYGRCTPTEASERFTGTPDVNLVPGLVFAEDGYRLGSGYGHYDRFIAKYPDSIHIGLAYKVQLRASLPTEPHDQRLDYIVTQDRVVDCNPS